MENKYIYPATLLCDFYKISHKSLYPQDTELIYSTWTARNSLKKGIDEVVFFGLQAFVKEYLIDYFNNNFFNRTVEHVVEEYVRVIKYCLDVENPDTQHIKALHNLGYLPVQIKAVKEGTLVPIKCPMITIENTLPEFFWITNYLETIMSNMLWQPTTSATIAYEYKKILTEYAKATYGENAENIVNFQCHDFSMRGMSSLESAKSSGAGHLLSFTGSDTIPAILYMEDFYNADVQQEVIGKSIPATEHSIQSAYGKDELASFKHILTEVYPEGYISIVSDTWDLWNVIESVIKPLKDIIMHRQGKFVVRPDSGDPVKVICGDPEGETYAEQCGVVELLWQIFGGTMSDKGYKLLDTHIGCIYGDAISLERCEEICRQLKANGYASTNMVFGVGSFSYQYNTRDTFGFALKSTYGVFGGEERFLSKDPITDSGVKKSQKGMVVVYKGRHCKLKYIDELDVRRYRQAMDSRQNLLEVVFNDGELYRDQNLKDIRRRLNG